MQTGKVFSTSTVGLNVIISIILGTFVTQYTGLNRGDYYVIMKEEK
jgi:hypothetical protein